jgi:ribosomal protein L30E
MRGIVLCVENEAKIPSGTVAFLGMLSFRMPTKSSHQTSVQLMQQLRRNISSLAAQPATDQPVLSAYVDLRKPMEEILAEWQAWTIRARQSWSAAQRVLFDEAKEQVVMAMRQEWPAGTQSVAIFARAGDHPLLLTLPFEASWEMRFEASNRPVIFPLVQMRDRFHRFLLVIATAEKSWIREVALGSVVQETVIARSEPADRDGRTMTREHMHHWQAEESRRMVRELVQVIGAMMTQRGLNHIVLAGHPRQIVPIKEHLPANLLPRVVAERFHAPNGHDDSALMEESLAAFVEAEQKESRATVERLHEQIRRQGLALVGMHSCRDAMLAGAVSQLVIAEELPHQDREELTRMAVMHDLPIEVCENDELLLSHGGVGCLLRYRQEYD